MNSNFDFLAEHSSVFYQLAHTAEELFSSDPNTTLIKLRQLGEALAQDVAVRCGLDVDEFSKQADLLYRLNRDIRLDQTVVSLFHTLRIEGNKATHQFKTQHKEAIEGLKIARRLAVWFHQSFGKQGTSFKPGPFVSPLDPSLELRELQNNIEKLKAELQETNQKLEDNQQLTKLQEQEKVKYAALAEHMDEEARVYELLAKEYEEKLSASKKEFDKSLADLQIQLDQKLTQQISKKVQKTSKNLPLNEELTRILIDQQLIQAGWDADTQELKYSKGSRPEKGKNKAIAEWPTRGRQSADYVLFTGLTPIAVVEAKKENTNVAGKIIQAERYARGFTLTGDHLPAWELSGLSQPWEDGQGDFFKVPFVYSCNGRPYVRQLAEQSGTWFRDIRSPANTKDPLYDFHTPEGLRDKLKRSKADAENSLEKEGVEYLKLRDYQLKAIAAVEAHLKDGCQTCLLAMATGTGKTRTILGLMYRFLKSERFKRILFLVDRTALGEQALGVFNETPLEQNQSLSKIYNIAVLGDMVSEAETRIQVATVQSMVKRIFQSDSPPNIDEFDCIIVDEAHRGYTLDQEMTDGELAVRDLNQYISSYRRVLDYFDSVKIAMTATPAKHTSDIFGKPVYTYSYREAVADDWLIDHEPPIRYETLLSTNGIKFAKGDQVSFINIKSGGIELSNLEDELDFEIDSFNKRVITEPFNNVICEQLAKELDPFGDEKTMIFCATDLHADMVKRLLDTAFKDLYGDTYNEVSVRKITGKSDKVDQLIRCYKNERYPNIAITVDLLTTGIDVPRICNLVFLRRIRSRILYEQMLGRATRRCDEIGKTVFMIYDPVDIYATLENVTSMKPLVKNPNVTLEQLAEELTDPKSLNAPGIQPGQTHAHDVLDTLSQKVMRILRKANKKAEKNTNLKEKLNVLEEIWSIPTDKLHQHLHNLGPHQAAEYIQKHRHLLEQLEEVKIMLGSDYFPIISNHEDKFIARDQNYGAFKKPADYLESFNEFIRTHINESTALSVVVNRPKDLTREQLKEIRILLDDHGFSKVSLKSAWRRATNHDIAASIVGYIRQAALGTTLIPFEQRVANAMQKIYSIHSWTTLQRKWLDRLAKQLTHEVVVDHHFVNRAFATDGGAKQLDKILDKELDNVLETLSDYLWEEVG